MDGERDLTTLIRTMAPALDVRPYVFAALAADSLTRECPDCLGWFREQEGVTAIVEAADADRLGVAGAPRWARITLTVHSSLSAVGFLARIASALAAAGISVNPVAAYYHDHLFVPWADRDRAMAVLDDLAAR